MTSNTTQQVKFLSTSLPEFTPDEVRNIGKDLFGLGGEIRPLTGERDLNFRLSAPDGGLFVVKFSNAEEDESVVDFQRQALMHLAQIAPDLPVPRVRRTLQGDLYTRVKNSAGSEHIVRSLSFLPGTTYFKKNRPVESWASLGGLLARLDLALRSFFHPAARHELVWDVQRAPLLRSHTGHIGDKTVRRNVDRALGRLADETMPRLKRLRHQVIHADIHADNILFDPADPDRITGILDFGDMVYGPLAAEIAVSADMDSVGLDRIPDCLEAFVSSYDEVVPLEEAELEVIFPLMLARAASHVTILAARRALSDGTAQIPESVDLPVEAFIEDLLVLGEARILASLRSACGYPNRRPAASVAATVKRRYGILGRHSTLFYNNPVQITGSRGAWLYGPNGEAYLDAYNNVPVAGHCHPRVVRAVSRQTAALNTNTRYLYDVILDYAERLTGTLDNSLSMCLFANSGSEANDIAWQISQFHTRRRGALVIEAAYHGITDSTRPMSPSNSTRPLAPHIRTLENPDPYRGRFKRNEGDLAQKYAADVDRAVAELRANGFEPAAFMVDSAFVSSGMPEVPAGYLAAVASKVRAAGGLVIADEVQAGFGRSGTHLWGHAAHGMRPDIVTMGKPVANGYPMGVVVTSREILEPFMAEYGVFSTFGGNPVACAAASAVLDVIEGERLIANARETGAYLLSEIRRRKDRYPVIGDVRGWGLLVGVELVRDRETMEPAPIETRRVLDMMRGNGVLMGSEGLHSNVLKIRPPLVFNRVHADILLAAFDATFDALEANQVE